MKKTLVKVKEVVDVLTGEIVVSETTSLLEKEPNFTKLYFKDLLNLIGFSGGIYEILFLIVEKMDYLNSVILIKSVKEDIAKKLNIKLDTVNKAITTLYNKGVLIRKLDSRSVYVVNPNYFAKGAWKDISKIKMQLEYTPEGRVLVTEFEAQKK